MGAITELIRKSSGAILDDLTLMEALRCWITDRSSRLASWPIPAVPEDYGSSLQGGQPDQ